MILATSLVIGLIFGIGISISGMIDPAKVLNFFDVAGTWDPSLGFVMAGALVVAGPGYALVFRRKRPALATGFQLPDTQRIDMPLIGGSAVFGVGWGIAGFCPGGALPALGTGRWEVFAFALALIVGIFFAKFLQTLGSRKSQTA